MAVLDIVPNEFEIIGDDIRRYLSPSGETYPTGDELYDRAEPMGDLKAERWWGDQTTIGIADKMDLYPIVASVYSAITLPISQAEYIFLPADNPSPRAVEIADALQNHFEKDALLSSIIASFLQYLKYGWFAHYVKWHNRNDLIAPVAFEPIYPRWHQFIDFGDNADKRGRPLTLNILNSRGESASLQYEHLLWLRHRSIGAGNWYGVPFYRAMYAAWNRAIHLLNWEMIQAEHLAGGIYAARHTDMAATVSIDEKKEIGNRLGRMRAGESSWIILPPGIEIDVLNVNAGDFSLTKQIQTANEQIMLAGFGQVMLIGLNSEGARATSETHLKMHYNGIKGIANELAYQFTRQITHKIVLHNWGQYEADNMTPNLLFDGLTPDNIEQRTAAIVAGVSGGVLSGTDIIENVYRKMLGIKPLQGSSLRKSAPPTSFSADNNDSIKLTDDGKTDAIDSMIKMHEEYKPKKFRRDSRGAEKYTDYQLSDLVLDTHKVTGRELILAEIKNGRRARARSLVAALKGDIDKIGVALPTAQVKNIKDKIEGITSLAAGYGYNEAKREIDRQKKGKIAPSTIEKKRKDKLAIQATAAITGKSIKLTIPTANRKQTIAELTDVLGPQLTEALEEEYSAVFLAQHRAGKIITLAEAEEILARREAVIAGAVAAEIGARAFSAGRNAFFNQFEKDEPQAIKSWVRSELNDANTCGPCEDIDGTIGDERLTDSGVYPFCESTKGAGNACRGMDIAILSDQFLKK